MQDELKTLIEQGRYFFQTHHYRKAEEMFRRVVEKKKEFADVYNYLGLIAHERGRTDDAIAAFEKALKINPRYTEALLNLSILYNDMGEYEKAKRLVVRSKKDAKKTPTAMDPFIRSKLANKHAEVGDWYKGVGAYGQAVEEYGKALGLEDRYVDIRTKMAVCLRELGRHGDALKELTRAVKDNPNFVDAYVQLGVTHFALGKGQEARRVWQDAGRRFPRNQSLKMHLKFTD